MWLDGTLTKAERLIERLRAQSWQVATIESCTGGLLAGCITTVPGASDVLERSVVTYSNTAKADMLGVTTANLMAFGAVSQPVALHMAQAGITRLNAHIGIAVTGIAGPGGATATKPVGLVHIAACRIDGACRHRAAVFAGDRTAVRLASVDAALALALTLTGEG